MASRTCLRTGELAFESKVDVVSGGIDRRQHCEQRLAAIQLVVLRPLLGLQKRRADQRGGQGGECEAVEPNLVSL